MTSDSLVNVQEAITSTAESEYKPLVETPEKVVTCTICSKRLWGIYHNLLGKLYCSECTEQLASDRINEISKKDFLKSLVPYDIEN